MYQYVNLDYPKLMKIENQLNMPLYKIDSFLEDELCNLLISQTNESMVPSPVVGSGNGVVNSNRTSSTVYLRREDTPTITNRICKLLKKDLNTLELPQVGRYLATQEYKAHYDAFDLDTEDGRRFASNGGQRVCTVLIYINDVEKGGETYFPKLNLKIKPKKGTALLFFPATLNGKLDENALHSAEPAMLNNEKYVCQIWIRQNNFDGSHNIELSTKI